MRKLSVGLATFLSFVFCNGLVDACPLCAEPHSGKPAAGKPELKPDHGRVTWRLVYGHGDEGKTITKNFTVPIDTVNAAVWEEFEFPHFTCKIQGGVDFTKIYVHERLTDKLLYERAFYQEPKNLLGDGFTGQNTVYHPTADARIEFSAFVGHAEDPREAPAEQPRLTDKPRDKLSDFSDEQIAAAVQNPGFRKFSNADVVLIGPIEASLDGVLQSFPPIYVYSVTITPTKVLVGDKQPNAPFTVRYSVSRGKKLTPPARYRLSGCTSGHGSSAHHLHEAGYR